MRIPALIPACTAALSGVLLLPAVALAANGARTPLDLDGEATTGGGAAQVGAGGGSIVRTIVGLAVVIAVIYGLTWVLRQVKVSRETSAAGSGLESLATLPLGTGKALHLVRAGGELVLVGVGEHGVTPIRTYSEEEARALGLLDAPVDGLETLVPTDPMTPANGGGIRRRLLDEVRRRTVIR
jgi:flagellar protein FliO/FliZ